MIYCPRGNLHTTSNDEGFEWLCRNFPPPPWKAAAIRKSWNGLAALGTLQMRRRGFSHGRLSPGNDFNVCRSQSRGPFLETMGRIMNIEEGIYYSWKSVPLQLVHRTRSRSFGECWLGWLDDGSTLSWSGWFWSSKQRSGWQFQTVVSTKRLNDNTW